MVTAFLKIKGKEYEVDDIDINIHLFNTINRVLDIEEEKNAVIYLSKEDWLKTRDWLSSNHWLLNFADNIDADALNIILDGHTLTIKEKDTTTYKKN